MSANSLLQAYSDRIQAICKKLGWKKDWANGGCYIHLEVSEFIEALRGKGEDPCPTSEAADVIIALLAVTGHYGIPVQDILYKLEDTLKTLESR